MRLNTAGVELKPGGSYKSAIMLSTANSSLHSVLSMDNAAGTAGSMRVFEMRFAAQKVHTKAQADELVQNLLTEIKETRGFHNPAEAAAEPAPSTPVALAAAPRSPVRLGSVS